MNARRKSLIQFKGDQYGKSAIKEYPRMTQQNYEKWGLTIARFMYAEDCARKLFLAGWNSHSHVYHQIGCQCSDCEEVRSFVQNI